jgi:hypothetical protein
MQRRVRDGVGKKERDGDHAESSNPTTADTLNQAASKEDTNMRRSCAESASERKHESSNRGSPAQSDQL